MNTPDPGLTRLDARLDGIAHVLRDRRLQVPTYQRSYAWGLEQVDTFWGDLRSAMLSAAPSYFLGTIVLSSEGPGRESTIIDGQQRLATAAILLAAIRDEFKEAGDNSRAQALQSEFLTYRDLKAGGERSRLVMNSNDAEFFSGVIAAGSGDQEPKGASTRRLRYAYATLKARVHEEAIAAKSNWQTRLIQWAEFLENQVSTIVVIVPTSSEAFLVFETLNDRGIALTVADLLKNYLYGISGARVQEVEAAWEATRATLESPDDEQRILDFLRQYWSSWNGAVRERDLYRSFRSLVRSEDHAAELAGRLASASSHFLALVTGDAALWPHHAVTQHEADTLRMLQLSQNRPLLLAAMDHFPKDELARLARATIAWMVRGIVVGGIGGGTTERYFCEAAVRVREGRVKTVEQVLAMLGPVVPSDEQFRGAVQTMSAPRPHLARYLLLAFEAHSNGDPSPSIVALETHAECVLQRILPRAPAPGCWLSFDGQDAAIWSRSLGNLVLLARGDDPPSAARDWAELQHTLALSSFTTSKALSELADWTPQAVSDRLNGFAQAAAVIWPREP